MVVNFLQFVANLIIALTVLKLLALKVLERDPESPLGKALAFVTC